MSGQLDRTLADIEHRVIERAKLAAKESGMPFEGELEVAAKELVPRECVYRISTRNGVWCFDVDINQEEDPRAP